MKTVRIAQNQDLAYMAFLSVSGPGLLVAPVLAWPCVPVPVWLCGGGQATYLLCEIWGDSRLYACMMSEKLIIFTLVHMMNQLNSQDCIWLASPCRDSEQRGGQLQVWRPQDEQPCLSLTTQAALDLAGRAVEKSLEILDALKSLGAYIIGGKDPMLA